MLQRKEASYCQTFHLKTASYIGHFTQAYAETFGPTEDGPATHLHIYDYHLARQSYIDGKLIIPQSIKTVSYDWEPFDA